MGNGIDKILKRQRAFYEEGTTKEYAFRRRALDRLAGALNAYEKELQEALYKDLGKSASESYFTEIGMVREEIAHAVRQLRGWMRPEWVLPSLSQLPAISYRLAQPYGVVLIMAPWNYPVLLCLDPLVDAIAAGNCVMLKPSAYAPSVSGVLGRMLRSVFPSRYVSVIEGGREVNGELLEKRFDYIFFTGGVEVGKLVLRKAAANLTPVTLELGGKSPCIVDETANLRLAARRIAFGKLLNCGQTCVAPDYLVVHRKSKERLLKLIACEITRMLGEEPLSNPDYPRMVNRKHFERVVGLMKGEKAVTGGGYREDTLQIAPTVLDQITLRSPVMLEEIFGPVLPVLEYETREELKDILLHFEKPLAFYLFTENGRMKRWALRTFSFGGGCINDTILHLASSKLPFGGVGASGMGSYHGKAGFETFSHRKSVLMKAGFPDIPLRYHPYSAWKDRLIKLLLG